MPLYYLDTSALLKRYRTENGTRVLDALFSGRTRDELLITSHFTAVEVESVAARALKGRLLTKKSHGVLLSLFADDLENVLIVLPVSTALLSEAATVARNYGLRASDALHMATALRARQASAAEIVFTVSDKELVEAAGRAGFAVLNPEAENALAELSELREQDDSRYTE
jgi:predicted nucleic acid-binding protein